MPASTAPGRTGRVARRLDRSQRRFRRRRRRRAGRPGHQRPGRGLAAGQPGRGAGAVDAELARLDRQASRFRADSEISWSTAPPAAGSPRQRRPRRGDRRRAGRGAVDRRTGRPDRRRRPHLAGLRPRLRRDRSRPAGRPLAGAGPVPGWQSVGLDGRCCGCPPGRRLDLGATAKGLGPTAPPRRRTRPAGAAACWSAWAATSPSPGSRRTAAGRSRGRRATRRTAPAGEPRRRGAGGQVVRLADGRRWPRRPSPAASGGGRAAVLHHIVDPRTGLPAAGPWRTVSVAAATCADANAAATAAIVAGATRRRWLAGQGCQPGWSAMTAACGCLGGWPGDGGQLEVPPASHVYRGVSDRDECCDDAWPPRPRRRRACGSSRAAAGSCCWCCSAPSWCSAWRPGRARRRGAGRASLSPSCTGRSSLFAVALLALHVVTAILDPFVTIGWAATVLPVPVRLPDAGDRPGHAGRRPRRRGAAHQPGPAAPGLPGLAGGALAGLPGLAGRVRPLPDRRQRPAHLVGRADRVGIARPRWRPPCSPAW